MFLDKFQEKSENLNVIALSVQELSRFCRRGGFEKPPPPQSEQGLLISCSLLCAPTVCSVIYYLNHTDHPPNAPFLHAASIATQKQAELYQLAITLVYFQHQGKLSKTRRSKNLQISTPQSLDRGRTRLLDMCFTLALYNILQYNCTTHQDISKQTETRTDRGRGKSVEQLSTTKKKDANNNI